MNSIPPIPKDLKPVSKLNDNRYMVFKLRYIRKDKDGNLLETVSDTIWRVSYIVAGGNTDNYNEVLAKKFYNLISNWRFVPNSPTFTGAGTDLGQLAACFVLPIEDSLSGPNGIMSTLNNASLIQQGGGGNGFSFSRLREHGSYINSSGGTSSGAVSFLSRYDNWFGNIKQGGVRRGANMGVLHVDHPEIMEFIDCKQGENAITNFNISVGITDNFMNAVLNDSDWELISPNTGEIKKILPAREIFDKIAVNAHSNGEPGLLFLDQANKYNPVPDLYTLETTNPCISGDTYVVTEEYGMVQVKNIIDKPINILSNNYFYKSDGFYSTGIKNVLLINTENGFSIKITDNHLLSVFNSKINRFEWKEAGKLDVGEKLEIAGNLHNFWKNKYSKKYDEITTITHLLNKEEVYDCKVPIAHAFDANELHVHNCGEQWLGPYENCCLGSINLSKYYNETTTISWDELETDIKLATIFLDNVVEYNKYIPTVPKLREAAMECRRIGLGIMGLADLMYMSSIRYNSEKGLEFAEVIMAFIRIKCLEQSILLAKEKGAFRAFKGSIYDSKDWRLPKLTKFKYLSKDIVDMINLKFANFNAAYIPLLHKYGIRNAAQNTIAPTGTIATVAGCEGYGCEPVFALGYKRYVNTLDGQDELTYVSPEFSKAMLKHYSSEIEYNKILEKVFYEGSCQNIKGIPDIIKDIFVVSTDITGEQHVRMQSVLQKYVDNSISKTCNLPYETTVEDVKKIYLQAYNENCKGITIYRTGSRNKVVLETESTKKIANTTESTQEIEPTQEISNIIKNNKSNNKIRPDLLSGIIYNESSSIGNIMICINDSNDGPFETFITSSKQGTSIMADCEAIGRLISYILRLNTNIISEYLLYEIGEQMKHIGGIKKNPPSMPHTIYNAITRHLGPINIDTIKKRKYKPIMYGNTYKIKSPCGKLYINIVNDDNGDPLNVIITAAKAGSDIAMHCEAIGRLISYCLQLDISNISPNIRLISIIGQLSKIGAGVTCGFGKNKVCSLADGISIALSKHINIKQTNIISDNICLGCGNSTIIYTEGCQICISCGYSKC